jgi:SAM-dependent methyltransferase/uncharacterized protein YbaR (Trm112 family)
MHPSFLNLLCCPQTEQPLTLEATEVRPDGSVMTGALRTPAGQRYPVVRGVPRFVGAELYSASFGFEWTRWPRVQFESENAGTAMQGYTTRMWERITAIPDERVRGATVVEFGCGPGRFLDVVRRKGGRAVGVDLSQAVEAARRNFTDDPDVLIVQGDILRPPFRDAAFDGGYTIGVLHHTPDPAAGLASLARRVRPGGWVACCVYPKGQFYDYPSVGRFRWLHNRVLKPTFGYGPALAYASFSARCLSPLFGAASGVRILRRLVHWVGCHWLPWLNLPDVRWRELDVFDAITPEHASTHVEGEVHRWMADAGCATVRTTDWCATSTTGYKL